MTILYLVRHGEVDARETFYGHLDLPLSEGGKEQIQRTAQALRTARPAAIYSSDLQRALASAEVIAKDHGLEPIPDPAFREMSLGVLEGLPYDQAMARFPQVAEKRYRDMWSYRFPQGENLQQVADRVRPALDRLLEAHAEADKPVVLVAHNSVNRVILGDALGLSLIDVFDFAQDFGCINKIAYGPRPLVHLLNWTPDALGTTKVR